TSAPTGSGPARATGWSSAASRPRSTRPPSSTPSPHRRPGPRTCALRSWTRGSSWTRRSTTTWSRRGSRDRPDQGPAQPAHRGRQARRAHQLRDGRPVRGRRAGRAHGQGVARALERRVRGAGGAAMSAPKRIQLRRTKGWRKPEGAVVVARRPKGANPIVVGASWTAPNGGRVVVADRAMATGMFAAHVRTWRPPLVERVRAALAGRDLACWCPLDQPCHADVLLEIANGGAS